MRSDSYGQVILNSNDIFAGLYSGKISSLNNLLFEDSPEIEKFNRAVRANYDSINLLEPYKQDPNETKELFDEANRCTWFMPVEYLDFPMEQWLLDQCSSEVERERVNQELELFIQHNMFDVLFYLKYLVDTMRSNKVVWGVGRGSSVASYILYLIGIHKVNSIKYNLDINEFLK